ncbi:hypothetical protein G9G63_10240 [Paenibacillus sp. EKM202P]|uniref:hypothetical protein n=1 Tax=unclassified Paenibacillus TaxID=185978 RepID=UPI0013EA3EF4|nr:MULTISPECIES: hypothetical protein [unclassified Paenibacillus]KAF6564513.1 hypothetical protein G9G63_10240 [Paenibacillus sp. EKM202P]KAF6571672.1 hypothetical protein G9G64_06535 [Paenibacillus sp. EKM207P]
MKEDEKRFLLDVYNRCANYAIHNPCTQGRRTTPRVLINEPDFYMHHKRAWYLLEKWSGKNWYEWGVTMDLGWLTLEGEKAAKELLRPKAPESTEQPSEAAAE